MISAKKGMVRAFKCFRIPELTFCNENDGYFKSVHDLEKHSNLELMHWHILHAFDLDDLSIVVIFSGVQYSFSFFSIN